MVDNGDAGGTIDEPRCSECLVTLEVAGTVDHPYWVCPDCRTAFLLDQ